MSIHPIRTFLLTAALALILGLAGCGSIVDDAGETASSAPEAAVQSEPETAPAPEEKDSLPEIESEASAPEEEVPKSEELPVITPEPITVPDDEVISFDPSWTYGEFSVINSGTAKLYYSHADTPKNITVCVNAGHGTKGGSSVKTQCHPDGTPKVTGGTTAEGSTHAVAVSTGTDLADGTPEYLATLKLSLLVKERLLEDGYNVLMIRETEDVQLDNIARTLMANAYADCHIAIHYDGSNADVGAFFMSVPNVASYRAMEPVASHYEEHDRLGNCVIEGLRSANVKIMGEGSVEMDLTQTSYSTVPSIDLEVGDKATDRSDDTLRRTAEGISQGLDIFFKK